jgi:hypothetical protein
VVLLLVIAFAVVIPLGVVVLVTRVVPVTIVVLLGGVELLLLGQSVMNV